MFDSIKKQIISFFQGKSRNLNTLALLLAVNIILAGIGFLTRIQLANILGKDSFGILSYGIAVAAYIETFARYGTDKTMVRDIIGQQNTVPEVILATVTLKFIIFCLCFATLLVYLYMNAMSDMAALMWVIVGSSLLSFEARGIYDGTGNTRRHTVYFAGYRILFFILIWSCLLFFPSWLTIKYVGGGMTVSVLLYLLVQYTWLINRYQFNRENTIRLVSELKRILKNNAYVCTAAMAALSFTFFNQIVLKKYCGEGELGIYAAAWQFFWIGNLFIIQIARVGEPILAKRIQFPENKKSNLNFILKYMVIMGLCILPIALPIIFVPELIITFFFSSEYTQSSSPLRLIGVYMVFLSIGMVFAQYIFASRKDRVYTLVVITTGLISMLFSFMIIPKYQATGAAVSLVVTHGLAIALYGVIVFYDLLQTNEQVSA